MLGQAPGGSMSARRGPLVANLSPSELVPSCACEGL